MHIPLTGSEEDTQLWRKFDSSQETDDPNVSAEMETFCRNITNESRGGKEDVLT